MAATNFTEDAIHKTATELLICLAEFTEAVHSELIFLSVVNIFLSIIAFLGNSLILVALHKESSLHPPSKLLYRNLTITDLCVGIIGEPLYAAYLMSVVNERWNICHYANLLTDITSYILCSVSLLTLAAISVDRLLALLLGLRYRQVVTLKRTCIIVIAFWIFSFVGTSTYLSDPFITSWFVKVIIPLCLLTSIFAYTKIFFALRHYQVQAQGYVSQGQLSQTIPLNIARYRKAVCTALWVQVTLVVCSLPVGIAFAITPQRGMPLSVYLARQVAATLLYFNSSLNPILYCWKIREVRQAVEDTLGKLCCSSSQ